MKLTIAHDGETQEVDIELSLGSLSLQEAVRIEEALGPIRWEQLTATEDMRSPLVLQAFIWSKVATLYPGIGREDFDFDLGALEELVEEPTAPVVIPMTTAEGTTEATLGKAKGSASG